MSASSPPQDGRTPSGWRVPRWLDLRVILPAAVALGLLGYVSSLAVAPESGDEIWAVIRNDWWVALLLAVPYIAARAVLWHELLSQLHVEVPWRPTLVALAGGEIAKTVPGGVYLQNYLLARMGHLGELSIVRSATATTAILALESLLALPLALILGIPNQPAVTWAIVGVVLAWIALLVVLWLLIRYGEVHLAPKTPRLVRHGLLVVDEFFEAAFELVSWRTVRALVPTATYMLTNVTVLYVIVLTVGIHTVTFLQTMGIYAVIVLSVILVPLPVKLGPTELAGLAIFVAYQIPPATAAIVVLALRVLTTGGTILLALTLLLLLRRELSSPRRPADAAEG